MNTSVKDVQVNDPDLDKVFVYRGLRLAIGKPYFPSGSGVNTGLIRSLGIVNEDGRWCCHVSDLDVDLDVAIWQAQHHVIDSMISEVYDGKYTIPSPKLYQKLQNLTNSSRDKNSLSEVNYAVQQIRSMLDEAWADANGIKEQELKNKAIDLVLEIERWFDC